jgi:hypothetical protein
MAELLKFETNILRKLCHLSELASHQIMKAQDGTVWLDSMTPLIYSMEEITMREGYVAHYKKKAPLHKEIIDQNLEFSNNLQKILDGVE